jgi:hypothetical protein
MSWSPNDLVSDADLEAYEQRILTQFGKDEWQAKRTKALEDWLFPSLAIVGYDPYRLRTRFQPTSVFGSTSSAFTDYTAESREVGTTEIPLATVLAASSDALYVGAPWQFRGLSVRMLDDVTSASTTLTVEVWRDAWTSLPFASDIQTTSGKPFSKGGTITWTLPEDWVVRAVNSSAPLYWVRIKLSAAPTSAAIGQIGVIRRSVCCGPAALRTLYYIFREARTTQEGPWEAKAEQYLRESEEAWQRIQPLLGREFDVDPVDDQIDATEATQTSEAVTGGGWSMERA